MSVYGSTINSKLRGDRVNKFLTKTKQKDYRFHLVVSQHCCSKTAEHSINVKRTEWISGVLTTVVLRLKQNE